MLSKMEEEFDHVAQSYDVSFTDTVVGKAQRGTVYRLLEDSIENWEDLNVLELNCGTGEDAIYIAEKGAKILATDISSEMVSVTESKTSYLPKVKSQKLDINKVAEIEDSFDLIFSNFGGLNCLSPKEFDLFIANSHSLLNKGGKLIMVIMPSFCLWETVYFSSKFKFSQAFRRRKVEGVMAEVEGKHVKTYYYSPKFIRKKNKNYIITKIAPVGFLVPPSYLNNWFRNKPNTIQKLINFDKKLINFNTLSSLSDHYFISLEKI